MDFLTDTFTQPGGPLFRDHTSDFGGAWINGRRVESVLKNTL
jgi:hypothetical protein